uniref:Uncharacterized protein n=1 Tax=Rhizophora mucronata TaxID=61149 RepID=A0A2P2QR87_RHIMU
MFFFFFSKKNESSPKIANGYLRILLGILGQLVVIQEKINKRWTFPRKGSLDRPFSCRKIMEDGGLDWREGEKMDRRRERNGRSLK